MVYWLLDIIRNASFEHQRSCLRIGGDSKATQQYAVVLKEWFCKEDSDMWADLSAT